MAFISSLVEVLLQIYGKRSMKLLHLFNALECYNKKTSKVTSNLLNLVTIF